MLRNRKTQAADTDSIAQNSSTMDYKQSNLPYDLLKEHNHHPEMTMETFGESLSRMRATFRSGKTKDVRFRRKQLEALMKLYEECREEIVDVLAADLRRPKQESIVFDVDIMTNELRNILHNLDNWTSPKKPSKGIANIFDDVLVYRQPYGVVLIIGAWNYPIQLCFVPMAAAIAAGNCVILKPSEVSVHSTKFLTETIPKYLDSDCYKVINGGVEETTEILRHKFDYIFYTGSTRVGQVIHAAANKFLTPVTLELGGKSPCYIDDTVDMGRAMRRLLWGKNSNAGQTCIAPDYVLCTKEVERKFVEEFKAVIKEWYGDDVQASPDYGRIATDGNFKRLVTFLNNGTVAAGGRYDPTDRFLEPTVLTDVGLNQPVMLEEIFGPILPIVTVRDVFEAINFINDREKPLSMYVFTTNSKDKDLMLNSTSSGSVCVNDSVQQFSVINLPFGGVGSSGMGSYHGKKSFMTFTHERGCLDKSIGFFIEKLASARYPPYSDAKTNYLSIMMRKWRLPSISLSHVLCLLIGVGCVFLYQFLSEKYD